MSRSTGLIRQDPWAASIFLRRDGSPLQPGDKLVQKDLARTLVVIAKRGPDAFYKGRIPRIVETAAKMNNGMVSGKMLPGFLYGANYWRRSAGLAMEY